MDDDERPVLIVGGPVFTARRGDPWAEALVMRGSRIVAVGPRERIAERYADAVAIDVEGRTVVPGLIDAHNHFLATGESLGAIDVRVPRVSSVHELVAALAEAAVTTPAGEWIDAYGFDHAAYERLPTRWDLDRASPTHPIRVLHVSGHHVLVNSMALGLRGIDDDATDPPGGELIRDEAGRVTGLCLDAAMSLVLPVAVDIGSHGPNFHTELPLDLAVTCVERAGRAFLEAGLTTVCDAQVTRRELMAYREARRTGRLPVRTVCMPLSHQLDELLTLGLAGPFGDEHLRIGALKLYADGSMIGGTAMFSEPYGRDGDLAGSMYHEPAELEELIVAAHLGGWQVGVHVQGDKAMTTVVDALEAAVRARSREHRHRLEHAGFPTPELVERIAALGAITVNQPRYLHDSGGDFLVALGDRAHRLQPLRDELDAGITVVLSSDSDVASYRPLDTIASAVDRRTRAGEPIGPAQALTVEEALFAHTIDAAYALWMDDLVGSIEPGKLADVAVIDGDLVGTPPDRLASLGVWLTMLGGRVAFATDPSLASSGT